MAIDKTLIPGARVFSRIVGQSGRVTRVFGAAMVTVQFPTGERTVPIGSLEEVVTDPFELLERGDIDSDHEWYEIRLRAARLLAEYGSDNLSGLVNSRVLMQPHQIFTAHRILEKPRPSMILADEVGLGKTVEAGLVMKELMARQSVNRILVATPPNLLNQWHTELRVKFNEVFDIVDSAVLARTRQLFAGSNPWSQFDHVLVSTYLIRSEAVRAELCEAGWDLVVLDEAHHCRRKLQGNSVIQTELYRTLDVLKDDAFGVLLLTATPMQLHPFELYSLVELVEPGLYAGYPDFDGEAFRATALTKGVKTLQGWEDETETERAQVVQTLHESQLPIAVSTPTEREEAVDAILAKLRLTSAITRNRKRTVGGFTKRRATTHSVSLSTQEQNIHAQVEAYLRAGHRAARTNNDQLLGLELVVYQRMLASSSRACRSALINRSRKLAKEAALVENLSDEDDVPPSSLSLVRRSLSEELEELTGLVDQLGLVRDSKVEALVQIVDAILRRKPNEKILIFTQFLATQALICERLGEYRLAQFNGKMNRTEKDKAVAHFRSEAQILVSTESGGEGRNFQFCHILVNYDLHWNPMRIEQRIGRLDRYGQRRNVLIYNLAVSGTIEDRLLDVLVRRLNLFEATVGGLELVLGDFEEDLSRSLVRAEGDVNAATSQFERDLDLRLKDAEKVEKRSADFLIELGSYRRQTAERLTRELTEGRVRLDLELLVLNVLAFFPTARFEVQEEVYTIQMPPALGHSVGVKLQSRYVGSFDAATAVADESLDFFGYGHPLVNACFSYARSDSGAGLTAVRYLEPELLDEPAIQLNYVLEFTGIRKWARVCSLVFQLDGRRRPDLEGAITAADPARDHASVALPPDTVERLRNRAVEELAAEAERQKTEVVALNARHVDAEARRAERIFKYNERRVLDRKVELESRIERLELEGDSERARIVPALHGQIEALGRTLRDHEAALSRKLEDVERLSAVSESFELVNAALLLPKELAT